MEFERRLNRDQGRAGNRGGCTTVIKPSEMSAVQTEILMEAFHEAGLPPGVINVVTGLGEVIGTELTREGCRKPRDRGREIRLVVA